MPPVRTVPAVKPVKTERTHEENQERAYIAASRRSDRSLEARIESARRASEIHKKRTGRALRVTEQDVVNEEMYEEEDDDLPAQYRRLTAHLQTNSVDFNRKLHAYLATHHAGRHALFDHSVAPGFGNPYPNAPNFAPQMMMQHQPPYQQQMLPPQMIHRSPQSFRHAPYPAAKHQTSLSSAAPREPAHHQPSGPPADTPDSSEPEDRHRRVSMPARPVRSPSASPKAATPPADDAALPSSFGYDGADSPYSTASPQPPHPPFTFSPQFHFNFDPSQHHLNFGPFSMALPTETQQMLGPALDPNDPQTAMLMGAGDMAPHPPFYDYTPDLESKQRLQHPSTQGMHQTLAPCSAPVMGISLDALDYGHLHATPPDGMPSSFAQNFGFSDGTPHDVFKGLSMTRENSAQGSSSGLITPGAEWAKFIDGAMFEEMPASK